MKPIRVAPSDTILEHRAFEERLRKLGIEVGDDGRVTNESAAGVKGGPAAVAAAAGRDRLLQPEETAKLRRAVGLIDRMRGREVTVAERATQSVAELELITSGLAGRVESLAGGVLSSARLDALTRNVEHLIAKAEVLLETPGALGEAAPSAVRAFARELTRLESGARALLTATATARTDMVATPGWSTDKTEVLSSVVAGRALSKLIADFAAPLVRRPDPPPVYTALADAFLRDVEAQPPEHLRGPFPDTTRRRLAETLERLHADVQISPIVLTRGLMLHKRAYMMAHYNQPTGSPATRASVARIDAVAAKTGTSPAVALVHAGILHVEAMAIRCPGAPHEFLRAIDPDVKV